MEKIDEAAELTKGKAAEGGAAVDDKVKKAVVGLPRTVNGTGHTGPSEFCATSI